MKVSSVFTTLLWIPLSSAQTPNTLVRRAEIVLPEGCRHKPKDATYNAVGTSCDDKVEGDSGVPTCLSGTPDEQWLLRCSGLEATGLCEVDTQALAEFCEEGAPYKSSADCPDTHRCRSGAKDIKHCAAKGAEIGKRCKVHADCDSWFCDALSHHCVARKGVLNHSCLKRIHCVRGLTCTTKPPPGAKGPAFACVSPPKTRALGAICETFDDCEEGLQCYVDIEAHKVCYPEAPTAGKA